MHYIWHHIHSLGHHTTFCMTSSPLYLTSRPLYLCHNTHPINYITATICMISQPLCLWHCIHYIYDIISTKYDIKTFCVVDTTLGICMTFFALQMTSHPLYHTKPQYLWCHILFRHDITPAVSDITATVSVSSHLLYWWYHNKYGSHHTWHMYDIIHILHEITLTIYDINAQYLWHHNHYIWHHIRAISGITSTVLIISHQLYLWDLICYIWHHNLWYQCSVFMTSQPLHLCH